MKRQNWLIGALSILTLILAASCGDDGGGLATVSSAQIGPAGGQITSADGGLTLTIPAGVLASTNTITITTIPEPQLPVDGLSDTPTRASWMLNRDSNEPLQGLMVLDATNVFTLPEEILQVITLEDAKGQITTPSPQTATLGADSSTTSIEITTLNLVLVRSADLGASLELLVPNSIAPASPGQVTATLEVGSVTAIPSGTTVSWLSTQSNPNFTSSISNEPPFSSGTLEPGNDYTDTFTLTCSMSPGTTMVDVTLKLMPEDINILPEYLIKASSPTSCSSQTGSTSPFVSSPGNLFNVEAANVVPPGSPWFDKNDPRVLVAGQAPGFGSAVAVISAANGAFVTSEIMTVSGTAFDALLIQSADNQQNALFTTGTSGTLTAFQTNGQLASGSQVFMRFFEDSSLFDIHDPGSGAISAAGFDIALTTIHPSNGPQQTLIPTNGIVASAIGSTTSSNLIYIDRQSNSLIFLDPTNDASETLITNLGSNPRRMCWDPQTGLGGLSDFSDDTITIFLWDGSNMPTIIGNAQVGAGPVGLDVEGNRIVCAGFNDDSWSLIEVDIAGQSITNVTTTALPHPNGTTGAPFQPGHGGFIRDANNTVSISLFGSSEVLFIPNAY